MGTDLRMQQRFGWAGVGLGADYKRKWRFWELVWGKVAFQLWNKLG